MVAAKNISASSGMLMARINGVVKKTRAQNNNIAS